jgi:signal transduction histidine kinase
MLKFLLNCSFICCVFVCASGACQNLQVSQHTTPDTQGEGKQKIIDLYAIYGRKQYEKAYQKAHQFLKISKDDYVSATSSVLLARYFKEKVLIDSTLFYANQALNYKKLGSDSLYVKLEAMVYGIKGGAYNVKGLFSESKKWYFKSIAAAQLYNEKELYFKSTHGLALVYNASGNYKKALELFKECLAYDDEDILFGSYINMGMVYGNLKSYELSNTYLEKAKVLSEKQNNEYGLAVILLNLAVNAHEQKDLEKAIDLYQKTVEIGNKIKLHNITFTARKHMGDVFFDMKNYKDAELIYSMALQNARELGLLDEQLKLYDDLKKISLQRENYQKAYFHTIDYYNIKDSIANLQKTKEINELEVKYETLKKEKEIRGLQLENTNRSLELSRQKDAIANLKLQQKIKEAETKNQRLIFQNDSEKRINEIKLLKKDQELQEANLTREKSIKNTILYSFLILLLPIIGLLVMYYQKLQTQSALNQKEKEVNTQKIATLLKDQELEVIKTSVESTDKERKRIAQELHDRIGGNLAAIKLQLNNPKISGQHYIKDINQQIDNTYVQVRNISHNLMPKTFVNHNFCDVVEGYLDTIGATSKINTSLAVFPRKVIDRLDLHLQEELFKIIQELITNTIKHAKANTVELHMNVSDKNTQLSIIFEDDGIGFNPETQEQGLGFINIKSRLEAISGILLIDSLKGRGTLINIEINNIKHRTDAV